jgi:hypothetical protein
VRVAGGILCFAAIVIAGFLFVQASRQNAGYTGHEVVYAFLALFLFYGVCMSVSGSLYPIDLAIGADGNLSASKFQFLVWNAAVVFSYIWIYAVRYSLHAGNELAAVGPIPIPHNVLYVMGFSIGTFAAAKAITVSYINAGRLSDDSKSSFAGQNEAGARQNANGQKPPDGNGLATTDGAPDLSKIQMLVWTLIAVALFLIETFHNVFGTSQAAVACSTLLPSNPMQLCQPLPDIDPVLMVLMGLSQAAYLGTKLTLSDAPILTSVTADSDGTNPRMVTVTGKNLSGLVMVLFGSAAQATAEAKSDTQVIVPFPAGLTPKVQVDVSVIVDGVKSANSLPLTP